MKNKLTPLILAAFIALSLSGSGVEAWPFHSSTLGQSCDALCQLFGTLAQGQWKQLVAPSGISGVSNFSAHALGYECGNPATNGACWCNDFDGLPTVGGTVCSAGSVKTTGSGWATLWYGSYPNDNPLYQAEAYTAAGIRKSDGMVMLRGGGHAITPYGGIGSVEGFNVEAAATNIVAGGNGGNWSLVIPGGRLIPNSYGKPPWSGQQDGNGCTGTDPWMTTNVLRQQAQNPGHSYWGISPIPGTTQWVLGASNFGCGPSGVDLSNGSLYRIDDTTKTGQVWLGPMFQGGGYDDLTGMIWSGDIEQYDADHLYTYNISSQANYATKQYGTACDPGNTAYGRFIVFPDPTSPKTDRDLIGTNLYGYNGSANSSSIFLRRHINGTPSDQCSRFLYDIPQYAVSGGEYAYDDDDGSFYWVQKNGGNIYHMVLNFTTLGNSTVTTVLTPPSGNIPNCANPGGGTFSAVEYIPASRPNSGGLAGIIISCDGLVWARRAPF